MVTNIEESARRAMALTIQIVEKLGPRPSGSERSRLAADLLGREASSFADSVSSEDFSVHPLAFLGWIRILVCLYVISVAMLWLGVHWVAALLTTLGFIILIGQFFLYRELVDWMFPVDTGRNVLASVEPEESPRGQLIISGHHDSAFVFNFLVGRPSLYLLRVTGGIISFVLLLVTCWVLTIWFLISGQAPGWSAFAAVTFSLLSILVGQLWWFASSEATPGAGDNLASSAAAWEALRVIAGQKAAGVGLQHLRVIAASWDAEEAGLRGSRHWGKARDDGRLDLPTWNLNLECLYDAGELFLLTSDVNGSVRLSTELATRCQDLLAGQGVEAPAKPIAFLTGGTDAGEIARVGAEATSLIGMAWGNTKRASVYHTPSDVPEAVDPDAVAKAIRLALDLARDLDEHLNESNA